MINNSNNNNSCGRSLVDERGKRGRGKGENEMNGQRETHKIATKPYTCCFERERGIQKERGKEGVRGISMSGGKGTDASFARIKERLNLCV